MHAQLNWQQSLSKLIEGNMRFRLGLRSVESFASSLRLRELAEKGQNPSAIILTCSDSRVPTEILFDKGVGDLFVIRVAGNVISNTAIASIEYAALVLQTPLCVVMGHTQCGAVRAAISSVVESSPAPTENLDSLLRKITPAVNEVFKANGTTNEETLLERSVLTNVQHQVRRLKERGQSLYSLTENGKFRIVGAVYNLHDGEVNFDLKDIPNFKIDNQLPLPSFKETPFISKQWGPS